VKLSKLDFIRSIELKRLGSEVVIGNFVRKGGSGITKICRDVEHFRCLCLNSEGLKAKFL
jgi:hypothetical protein